jgi:hypothetical protein
VESILIIMSMVSSISKKEGRITGYMYLIVELNIFADFSSTLFHTFFKYSSRFNATMIISL